MVSLRLIYLPPASLKWPSIGLSQLKATLEANFAPEVVAVEIDYWNFAFAEFVGAEAYKAFTQTYTTRGYNFLEWLFRAAAFPDLPNNQPEFFRAEMLEPVRMFLPDEHPEDKRKVYFANELLKKRPQIPAFIDQMIAERRLAEMDVVGFTSMFNQNLPILAVARRLKQLNPKVTILMGGSNCQSPMGEEIARNFTDIDFVFSGSAMKSFPTFVARWLANDSAGLHAINGVFSRQNLERVDSQPSAARHSGAVVRRLGEELPFRAYPALSYDDFLRHYEQFRHLDLPEPGLFLETSRGCWYGEKAHCTFCGLNALGMQYESANIETAVRHLSGVIGKYRERVKDYAAVDNIMPRIFPEKVLPQLDLDQEEVNIFYEVKSDLSRAQLEVMHASGIKSLQPGIEALDNSLLKLMKKGVTSTQNLRFLKDCHEVGMNVLWNLLVGLPGEDGSAYPHYLKALPALVHLPPPAAVGGIYFIRYSPYHSFAESYGLDLIPARQYALMYPPLAEASLENFAFYFQTRTHDAAFIQNRRRWKNQLNQLVLHWQTRYDARDGGEAPELYRGAVAGTVIDTRSGERESHRLDPLEWRMLDALRQPMGRGRLRNHFSDLPDAAFAQRLQGLIDRALVFTDRMNSFISLVFDRPVRTQRKVVKYSFYA
ncbi:MAG: RiPP maturation radical SAM C-methyltransferase [Bacteroidota bacterium]